VPEKIIGTFTLSILKIHAHLDTPYNILKLYSVATPGHPKPLLLEYYVVIIALTPDLQRVFFLYHNRVPPPQLYHELILPLILNQGVLSEL
jgi:hypothetical protein